MSNTRQNGYEIGETVEWRIAFDIYWGGTIRAFTPSGVILQSHHTGRTYIRQFHEIRKGL